MPAEFELLLIYVTFTGVDYLHHVSPRDQIKVLRLGSMVAYPLSHLTGPNDYFLEGIKDTGKQNSWQ